MTAVSDSNSCVDVTERRSPLHAATTLRRATSHRPTAHRLELADNRLDRSHLRDWAAVLGVVDDVEALLREVDRWLDDH